MTSVSMHCSRALAAAALVLGVGFAHAHKASDAYVQLDGGGISATLTGTHLKWAGGSRDCAL